MIQSRIQFRQLCAIAYLPIVESPLPGDIESMRVIRKIIFSYDEEGEKSIDLLFTRVFFFDGARNFIGCERVSYEDTILGVN